MLTPCTGGWVPYISRLAVSIDYLPGTCSEKWSQSECLSWEPFGLSRQQGPGRSPAFEWALSGPGKPISLIIYWKNIFFLAQSLPWFQLLKSNIEELKRKGRGGRGCWKTYMIVYAHTRTPTRCIETHKKAACLPDFIKVNCRSERAAFTHKSRIWMQVKAMRRNKTWINGL